jgi:hypothetical protein
MRSFLAWSEQEWEAAAGRLRDREWLEATGRLTDEGQEGRRRLEQRTDSLAGAGPVRALGTAGRERLTGLLGGLSERILAGGGLPIRNPMGLTTPAAAAR